jgi:hypothetical protein
MKVANRWSWGARRDLAPTPPKFDLTCHSTSRLGRTSPNGNFKAEIQPPSRNIHQSHEARRPQHPPPLLYRLAHPYRRTSPSPFIDPALTILLFIQVKQGSHNYYVIFITVIFSLAFSVADIVITSSLRMISRLNLVTRRGEGGAESGSKAP